MNNGGAKAPNEIVATVEAFVSADRPIDSRRDDRLQRSRFADELARVIRQWRGRESLVIALLGPWGSGKTSVKNLVVETLRSDREGCPELIEFNPWQWSGHDDISAAFFREIGKRLGRKDSSKRAKQVAKTLKTYAALLGLGRHVVGGIPKLLGSLALVGLTGLVAARIDMLVEFSAAFQTVGVTALLLAGILGFSERALNLTSDWLATRSELTTKTLSELKAELVTELGAVERQLLVVIDDIDRLASEEVRAVFQLVKANADFPNIIYLLPFQRSALAALIDSVGGDDAYLEKIIQVAFDVPQISQADVDLVLTERLNLLFAREIARGAFDQGRWTNLYEGGLRRYFVDLRDVNRFVASLAFYAEVLRTSNSIEVNPVDLVAVETLRLYEPDVYLLLRESRELMVGHTLSDHRDEEIYGKQIVAIADEAPEDRRSRTREILRQLFPNRDWAFDGVHYGADFESEWTKELRVCAREMFSRYFQLRLPEGAIPQAEIDSLLQLTAAKAAFGARLADHSKEGRLVAALDGLALRVEDIAGDHIVSVITALFDLGEKLPDTQPGFTFAPEWTLQRIVKQLLERETDLNQRATLLSEAILASSGLSMPVMRVSLERDRAERAQGGTTLRAEDIPRLQELCVNRLRAFAADGRLARQRDLASLLFRWSEWSSEEEVKVWVGTIIATNEGLLTFLRAFVQRSVSQTMGDHYAKIRWYIKPSAIEKFASLSQLEPRVASISSSGLGSEDLRAIEAFKEALAKARAGKAEEAFWDGDDS